MKFSLNSGGRWFTQARQRAEIKQARQRAESHPVGRPVGRPVIGPVIALSALLIAALLQGCSAMKMAYNQAPELAYWYLDAYVDFSPAQRPQVQDALGQLHAWHRQTQLPGYIDTLQKLRPQLPNDMEPGQACTVYAEVRQQLLSVPAQFEPTVAALVGQLSTEQLAHIERRFAKKDAEFQDDFIDIPAQKAHDQRRKKAIERAEMLYGQLDAAQLAVVQQRVDASGFDARQSYAERLRREQDLLNTLRPLVAHQASATAAQAAISAWWQRTLASPDPAYRAYQEKMEQESCTTFAAVHNSTTPEQRRKAAEALSRYERNFRALAIPPA